MSESTHDRTLLSLAGLLLLAFVALNHGWLGQDRLVRDGDEEGHVGAAELFVVDLEEGAWVQAARRATVEDMGDYPALYPAVVGGWWWFTGYGDPARPQVRTINLAFLLLAGIGVWGAARNLNLPPGASALGGALVLFLPLNAGLGRHFMPEGALAAAVAMSIWAATRLRERKSAGPALALGLALAAGMLTKQTFPLYVAAPLIVLVRPGPHMVWIALGLAAAAPWYVNNLQEQLAYMELSTSYAAPVPWTDKLLYYPRALLSNALGPVWVLITLAAAVVGLRDKRRATLVGVAWLVGGVILLTLIPKKYDRLLAPLLPAAGLVMASAMPRRPEIAPMALLAVPWTIWLSLADSRWNTPSEAEEAFHPGCVQRWLRPPVNHDLGYAAVANAVRRRPWGPIKVVDPPEIPCAVQTTFPWDYHLEPYLRRVGLERPVVSDGDATLIVDFSERAAGREVYRITPLDVDMVIRSGELLTP